MYIIITKNVILNSKNIICFKFKIAFIFIYFKVFLSFSIKLCKLKLKELYCEENKLFVNEPVYAIQEREVLSLKVSSVFESYVSLTYVLCYSMKNKFHKVVFLDVCEI